MSFRLVCDSLLFGAKDRAEKISRTPDTFLGCSRAALSSGMNLIMWATGEMLSAEKDRDIPGRSGWARGTVSKDGATMVSGGDGLERAKPIVESTPNSEDPVRSPRSGAPSLGALKLKRNSFLRLGDMGEPFEPDDLAGLETGVSVDTSPPRRPEASALPFLRSIESSCVLDCEDTELPSSLQKGLSAEADELGGPT
jgi:hypothetical protein